MAWWDPFASVLDDIFGQVAANTQDFALPFSANKL